MFAKYATVAIVGMLSFATAFDLSIYSSERCTGLAISKETAVDKGCQTDLGSGAAAIINKWSSEEDNKLILATYSDDTCCHTNMIEMLTWTAGCTQIKEGVQGWRVLDPNDPDTGKEGEDYSCDA